VRRFQQGQQLDSGEPATTSCDDPKRAQGITNTYVGSAAGNGSSTGTAYTGALAGNDASMARTQSANLWNN
jgi:hypothetical protein